MIPTLYLYFKNKDDERYLEMPDWVRDLSWVIFTGDGEDDYVLIPKPYEVGMMFATIPERMMEYLYTNDEQELADAIGWVMVEAFNLNMIPQAFTPLYEQAVNRNFTGSPIVPEYLQTVEPSEQYRAYTSDAMVALGRRLGISPLRAEHLVRGYLGTLGTWGLGAADYMMGDITEGGVRPAASWQDNFLLSRFVNSGPLRRTRSENDFYEMLQETRRVSTTLALIQDRSPERVEEYVSDAQRQVMGALNRDLNRIARDLAEINNAMATIRSLPDITAEEKRRQIDGLQRAKNQLSHEVMHNINRTEVERIAEQITAAAQAGDQPAAGVQ